VVFGARERPPIERVRCYNVRISPR
jgi:hypothetical protein